jgi:hypothetical protein
MESYTRSMSFHMSFLMLLLTQLFMLYCEFVIHNVEVYLNWYFSHYIKTM